MKLDAEFRKTLQNRGFWLVEVCECGCGCVWVCLQNHVALQVGSGHGSVAEEAPSLRSGFPRIRDPFWESFKQGP